ncbi:MAG: hypothetical protein MRY21_03535 [Simkaniaceae bacterium]|nr:hypothetical protein [Simkaniaceae bacterium]
MTTRLTLAIPETGPQFEPIQTPLEQVGFFHLVRRNILEPVVGNNRCAQISFGLVISPVIAVLGLAYLATNLAYLIFFGCSNCCHRNQG